MKGHDDRAIKIIKRLHPQQDGNHHDFAHAEFLEIKQQLAMQTESEGFWKLLKHKANRKRFFMGFFVQCVFLPNKNPEQ